VGGGHPNRQDTSIAIINQLSQLFNYYTTTNMSDYLSTENQVACLAQAIHNGEYPSIAEATRENPDLYGRVKNRVAGRTSRSNRPATNRLLNDTEEEGIML
jgi:hypothetical protein